MGLDSVELVMEIEKYFNIQIPDQEAEKITTVQLMTDAVAGHLSVSKDDSELKDSIIKKVQKGLTYMSLTNKQIKSEDYIFLILDPSDKKTWGLFQNHLLLKIPRPSVKWKEPKNVWNKIKNQFIWSPTYDWREISLDHFVTAICSKNRDKLIPKTITDKFQIYAAIMGITVDKIGVDEYDITPEKSFTDDLGVD